MLLPYQNDQIIKLTWDVRLQIFKFQIFSFLMGFQCPL